MVFQNICAGFPAGKAGRNFSRFRALKKTEPCSSSAWFCLFLILFHCNILSLFFRNSVYTSFRFRRGRARWGKFFCRGLRTWHFWSLRKPYAPCNPSIWSCSLNGGSLFSHPRPVSGWKNNSRADRASPESLPPEYSYGWLPVHHRRSSEHLPV